ncbi:MAG: leucine-rich repeat domain-containing protein [Bacilli bacterium]|jgi:hypothetical protein|nr:leucine-rich repeat domain-containing protein [Bacilli bacterium]
MEKENERKLNNKKIKKVVVLSLCFLLVVGGAVGTTILVKNTLDVRSFEEQATSAFNKYYNNLVLSDAVTMGNLRVVYSDGNQYQVFLGKNTSSYLGKWNKEDNAFSNDSSKNYLIDINSLGQKVIVNINKFSSITSDYRSSKKDEIIPADEGTQLTTIDSDGEIVAKTRPVFWGAPVFYYSGKALCKYNPKYNDGTTDQMFDTRFQDLFISNYPSESLYKDANGHTSWARVFSSSKDCVIHGAKETDYPVSDDTNSLVLPSYGDFCSDLSSYFGKKKTTPFSTAESLEIDGGITHIGDGSEGALSAFTGLMSLKIDATTDEILDSSYVFGRQTEDFASSLASINFGTPNGIFSISDDAFNGIKALKSIVLNSNNAVTQKCKIGKRAFKGCTNLEKVSLPDLGYISIDSGAFLGCDSFAKIYSAPDLMFEVPSSFVFAYASGANDENGFPFPSNMFLDFADVNSESCKSFITSYSGYPRYFYLGALGTLEDRVNDSHERVTNIFSNLITDGPAKDAKEIYLPSAIKSVAQGKSLLIPYIHDGKVVVPAVHSALATGSIVLNPDNKTTTLKLTQDIVLYGSLQVGGLTNFASSVSYQGFVVGEYAELDLNGFKVIVESGGSLDIAGNLVDSSPSKTGEVIVHNGGKVKSNFALCDFNGGTNTFSRLGLGVSPFNFYMMPYLNAKIHFEYGSSLVGYCVLFAGGNHNSIEVNMIGNESESSLIAWDSEQPTSYIDRTQEDYPTVVITDKDLSKYKEHYNFYGSFKSTPMDFGVMSGETLIGICTGLIDFPVSPFIDVAFQGTGTNEKGKLTIGNTFMMLPGSKVEIAQNEDLVFAPTPRIDYCFRTGVWGQQEYNAPYHFLTTGGITGIFDDFYQRLGSENKESILDIKGNVVFKELNGMPKYVLAGNVLASDTTVEQISQNVSKITDEAVGIVPEGYDTLDISKYIVSPLKLNGFVTKLGTNLKLTEDSARPGIYNDTSTGNCYFFKLVNNSYLCQLGTVPPNFDYPVAAGRYISNQDGELTKASTYSDTQHFLTYNEQTFVYFNGLFVGIDPQTLISSLTRFLGQTTDIDLGGSQMVYDNTLNYWKTQVQYSHPPKE